MLYLDIGNSILKLKAHHGDSWRELARTPSDNPSAVIRKINDAGKVRVMVSSVRKDINQRLAAECNHAELRIIQITDFGLDRILYDTPGTLGIDRVLACEGARILSKGESVIVVDAGTACTVDLMDDHGNFHGGVIMPGIASLEKALKSAAPELPVVDRKIPDRWPARSTADAIQWGLTGLFVQSVRWLLERYRDQYGDPDIWLTGGDALLLKRYLGGRVQINPDLVFEGMLGMAGKGMG
jgi:type III pantothenate kinase